MRAHERFEVVQDLQKNTDNRCGHDGDIGGIDGITDKNDSRAGGFVVTRSCICVTTVMFALLLGASVLLTYNFGKCSDINVQSEVCDKENVIPITIALNNSQSVDEDAMRAVQFEEDINRSNRTNIRLPETMHPLYYELKLMPFLVPGNFTFNGDVRILVNVTKSCRNITLHATALRIGTVSVWSIGNATQTDDTHRSEMKVTQQFLRTPDQLFVIVFDTDLQPNNIYEVQIKYTGVLNDMLQGFYRSSYEFNNETR